jgi:hypothetical protein
LVHDDIEMSPKNQKIAKYTRTELEELAQGPGGRKEIQALARAERDDGKEVGGALSRATEEIIESLLKLKILAPTTQSESHTEPDTAKARGKDSANTDLGTTSSERAKLEPPSSLPTEPTRMQYRTWSREVAIWKQTHASHSDQSLVSSILKALAAVEKELVFSSHGETRAVTLSSLLETLELPYAGDELAERRRKLGAFRKCVRAKRPLQRFLADWDQQRRVCVELGVLSSIMLEQDTWDLLDASDLDAPQRASIMHELSTRNSLRKELGLAEMTESEQFETAKKLLRELALSFELSEEEPSKSAKSGKPKWSEEATALFAKGKAKGKGAKGSDAGKSGAKSDLECFNCHKKGHFASECWSKGSAKGKGKGGKKGKGAAKGGKGKGAKKKLTCWNCGKEGHVSTECWSEKNEKQAKGGDKGAAQTEPE